MSVVTKVQYSDLNLDTSFCGGHLTQNTLHVRHLFLSMHTANRFVVPAFIAWMKVLAQFHSTMLVVALLLSYERSGPEDYHIARHKKRK